MRSCEQKVHSVARNLVYDNFYGIAERKFFCAANYAQTFLIEKRGRRKRRDAHKPLGGVFEFDEKPELGDGAYNAVEFFADRVNLLRFRSDCDIMFG